MNPSGELNDDTVVAAATDQLTCDLSGEAAVLHLPDGMYYGLNETGAFLWERLQQPVRVGDLLGALVEAFEISEDDARRDVLALLDELREAKLIEVRDGAGA